MQKSHYIDTSITMSCVSMCLTKDIAENIIEEVIKLQNHTQPLIRKKAYGLLAKIFLIVPELIPGNLEKVLARIVKEETVPGNNNI